MFLARNRKKKHGMLLDRPVEDDGRCKNCGGVCCRSFPSVRITGEEFNVLQSLGACRLHFSLTGHHLLIIENGCEFLTPGGHCSIYHQRPEICRRFFCRDTIGEGE